MKRMLPTVAAVAAVVAAGVVHGFWTDRWHTGAAVAAAVANLDKVPRSVGDWEAEPLTSDLQDQSIAGQLYLRYVNRKSGDIVSVVLTCGRPGPVSIHTPDVCYGASGFTVGKTSSFELKRDKSAARFLTTEATNARAASRRKVRIFWSWFAGGRWSAPDNPRWAFAGLPVLYKFYVIRDVAVDTPVERDPCVDFLRLFVPELEKAFGAN